MGRAWAVVLLMQLTACLTPPEWARDHHPVAATAPEEKAARVSPRADVPEVRLLSDGSFELDARDGKSALLKAKSTQELDDFFRSLAPPRATYALVVAREVSGQVLREAIQTAGADGWSSGVIRTPGGTVSVESSIGRENGDTIESLLPPRVLVFVVRPIGVELWVADVSSVLSIETTPNARPQKLAELSAGAADSKLEQLLRVHCKTKADCRASLLFVAEDAPFSTVSPVLSALALTTAVHGELAPFLRLANETLPSPGEAPDVSHVGSSGRLPPEVIQRVVRDHYDRFKTCYAAGLGRDAKLRGRVSVRFVIERDGSVKDAKDANSDMPDKEVIQCIVNEFTKFSFPKPDGGIVTVVYPIMLSPG